jgi:hypothetical protein
MAMGRRKRDRQEALFVSSQDLPRSAGHPPNLNKIENQLITLSSPKICGFNQSTGNTRVGR